MNHAQESVAAESRDVRRTADRQASGASRHAGGIPFPASAQRKLVDTVNESPRQTTQRAGIERVHASPHVREQGAQLRSIFGQRADSIERKASNMVGPPPAEAKIGSSQVAQKVDAQHAAKLEQAYDQASKDEGEGNVDEKYLYYLQQLEYPFDDDPECERPPDAPIQLKAKVVQLARTPGSISGPKSYGGLNNILYQLDGVGNIDFANPYQYVLGNAYPGLNPVMGGSVVDITNAVNNHGTANRYQHFKEANQIAPQFNGAGGNSPAGLTWHHLTSQYDMHLVDRTVHSKHGHNGGVHIW